MTARWDNVIIITPFQMDLYPPYKSDLLLLNEVAIQLA
jgi:hypothetical protein